MIHTPVLPNENAGREPEFPDKAPSMMPLADALCSSSDAGHEALMTMYRTRLQEQIELVTAEMLPELWPRH